MKPRSEQELRNLQLIQETGKSFGTLRPSKIGLDKAILDATIPFKEFLRDAGVHDYETQAVGPASKKLLPSVLIGADRDAFESATSMYRPQTKRGDARIWIRHLRQIIGPDDLMLCFWSDGKLWVTNATRADLHVALSRAGVNLQATGDYLVDAPPPSVFEELLSSLQKVASKGFIQAPVDGPTAVGRLLESELGIDMNSAKEPDYNGIEIKSSRVGSRRVTLFAQVPDWANSQYVRSSQLLQDFGREKPEGGRTLSCTLSVPNVNTQGLFLHFDRDFDLLRVRHDEFDPKNIVQWSMDVLRQRVASKHAETVWVEADVRRIGLQEYLRFRAVRHTRGPKPSELRNLIVDGDITVDFLIREDHDKGYLFKIRANRLDDLFTHTKRYVLSD